MDIFYSHLTHNMYECVSAIVIQEWNPFCYCNVLYVYSINRKIIGNV